MTNKTNIPIETIPAYERPIDKSSIDKRMAEQLEFENRSRTSPREISLPEDSPAKEAATSKTKKALAIGTAIVSGAVMTHLVGKAIDQELKTGEPPAYVKSNLDSRGMLRPSPDNTAQDK